MTGAARQPQLLLAGGGHSHVLVLRQWALRPQSRPASGSVTLVSRYPTSLYSGLVPAVVAGLATLDSARFDLKQLCQQAGVSFLQAEITGLELGPRQLLLQGGERLDWDILSLDVGAITPAPADGAMAVKPLEPFLAWVNGLPAGAPLRLRGGGASAVELALALGRRGHPCRLLLRGPELALGSRAANRAERPDLHVVERELVGQHRARALPRAAERAHEVGIDVAHEVSRSRKHAVVDEGDGPDVTGGLERVCVAEIDGVALRRPSQVNDSCLCLARGKSVGEHR